LAAIAGVSPLAAQEDFRSADLGRPILVEDAYPLKLYEWEFELGMRGNLAEEGGLEGMAELKTGLFLNGQAGLEIEAGVEDQAGTVGGIEAVRGHVLYSFSRETLGLPAFAARVDLATPGAGGLRNEDWSIGLKGIVTRSFGRVRMHVNGGYVAASVDDDGDYWRLGLAFDYPIGLFSKAIMGDIYAELPVSAGRARVWAEVGMRWQVSNVSVVDFGIASRLDEWEAGNANLQLIVGLSRVFGLVGQVSVPSDLNPRID
jgi:hypothetical protein